MSAYGRHASAGVSHRAPKRAKQSPGPFPFGYIDASGSDPRSAGVPVLDRDIAAALRAVKDQFLAGKSTTEIMQWLDRSGVRPQRARKWARQSLLRLLANPFYAGFIRLGASYERNPKTGCRRRAHQKLGGRPVWRMGRHEALWSLMEYERIRMELRERASEPPHKLSGLLRCGFCGRRLRPGRMRVRGSQDDLVWYCRTEPEFFETVVQDCEVVKSVSSIIARDLQTWRRAAQRKGRPRSRVARERRRALKKVEDALAADPAYLETGADLVVNQLLKGAIAEILVGAGRVEVVPR